MTVKQLTRRLEMAEVRLERARDKVCACKQEVQGLKDDIRQARKNQRATRTPVVNRMICTGSVCV